MDYSESKDSATFPYKNVVGSLQYLGTKTRPDLSVTGSLRGKHVSKATKEHEKGAVSALRYLNFTKNEGLLLESGDSNQLSARIDARWVYEAGNQRRTRSEIAIFTVLL